ncbi:MAG: hypothetical protein R3F62_17695 [Planctomycetota bacterium]
MQPRAVEVTRGDLVGGVPRGLDQPVVGRLVDQLQRQQGLGQRGGGPLLSLEGQAPRHADHAQLAPGVVELEGEHALGLYELTRETQGPRTAEAHAARRLGSVVEQVARGEHALGALGEGGRRGAGRAARHRAPLELDQVAEDPARDLDLPRVEGLLKARPRDRGLQRDQELLLHEVGHRHQHVVAGDPPLFEQVVDPHLPGEGRAEQVQVVRREPLDHLLPGAPLGAQHDPGAGHDPLDPAALVLAARDLEQHALGLEQEPLALLQLVANERGHVAGNELEQGVSPQEQVLDLLAQVFAQRLPHGLGVGLGGEEVLLALLAPVVANPLQGLAREHAGVAQDLDQARLPAAPRAVKVRPSSWKYRRTEASPPRCTSRVPASPLSRGTQRPRPDRPLPRGSGPPRAPPAPP